MNAPKNTTPRVAFILVLDFVILLGLVVLTIERGFEDLGFAWGILFWLLASHLYMQRGNRSRPPDRS